MPRSLALSLPCLLSIWPLAAACGAEGGAAQAGMIRGLLNYQGSHAGEVEVAVFGSFPPRGTPMARQRIAEAAFPLRYAVGPLPAGRYFVLAIVDTDPQDGERFHPRLDPGGAFGGFTSPVAVTVDAVEGRGAVDIELADPSDNSPWIRGGYR